MSVEDRLSAIESRNAKVEADKAWETSLARRGFLALITWLAAGFTLSLLGSENAWILALVPVMGYIISTLSLPYIRQFWLTKVHKQ
jgi:hypothetical protein